MLQANEFVQNPRGGIGGNNPPLIEELREKYADDVKLAEDLMADSARVPDRVDDDENQSKVAEFVKKLRALEIKLDKARDVEKAPHAARVDEVNGFFKTRTTQLEARRRAINKVSEEYLQRKADAEKRRIAEEADKKRAEQERLLALAQETERTKNDEQAALNSFVAKQDEARKERSAATTDVDVLRADLATAEAELAKVQYDNAMIAADIARKAQAGTPMPDTDRADKKLAATTALSVAKQAVMTCKQDLDAGRERARKAKEEQIKADEAARQQAAVVKFAERDTNEHLLNATRADKQADRLEKVAKGPEADLARTRSEHGAVSTLSRRWESSVTDRSLLDKNALWHHIHQDALEAALHKWMMAQAPESRRMAGARMEEVTVGQVR